MFSLKFVEVITHLILDSIMFVFISGMNMTAPYTAHNIPFLLRYFKLNYEAALKLYDLWRRLGADFNLG